MKHLFKHFSPPKRVTEQLHHLGDGLGPIVHMKRPSIFHIGFSLASTVESGIYQSDSTTIDVNEKESLGRSGSTLNSCLNGCADHTSSEVKIVVNSDYKEVANPSVEGQGGGEKEFKG